MATKFPPYMSFHGSTWTPEQEDILQDMHNDGVDLPVIARTLGRSDNACYSRLRQIRTTSPLRRYIPKEDRRVVSTIGTPVPPKTDYIRTVAVSLMYPPLKPVAISSPAATKPTPSAKATSGVQSHSDKVTDDKDIPTQKIIEKITRLTVKPPPPSPPTFCQYCDRPAIKIGNIQQLVCSACKCVQENYTTTGLLNFIRKIKLAAELPWCHTQISADAKTHIVQVEYPKHLETVPPTYITKNGIEERKKRGSCESLVNIAGIYGLIDIYTGIQGHWSTCHQFDPCCQLTFAYIKNNKGKTTLLPTLAVIAEIAQDSTEESIQQWLAALQQKKVIDRVE